MFARLGLPLRKPLWVLGFMLFFMTLFDGTLGYTIPLLITQSGLSNSTLGLIMGSSSIVGGAVDLLLCRYLPHTHFRRIFLGMLAAAFLYCIVLSQASALLLFVLAMALWGIWFDLKIFGTFNFVGQNMTEKEHASSFGTVSMLEGLGYLLAPLIAGFIIIDIVDWKPFALALTFLGFAVLFYFAVVGMTVHKSSEISTKRKRTVYGFLVELRQWKNVGRPMFPVLCFLIIMNVFDSFFWTIGPLVSEELSDVSRLGYLFITVYSLPAFLTSWLVGPITQRFGKKRTAFVSLILGSLVLSGFALFQSPIVLLVIIFVSSALSSLAWPAMKGAAADYISEAPVVEKEIEGITDFAGNFGYVIGPITAGFLSDFIGNHATFSVLGIIGLVVGLVLFKFTPKHIKIVNRLDL